MSAQAPGAVTEAASSVPREEALDAEIRAIGRRARAASRVLATCPTSVKDAALRAMAQSLRKHEEFIIDANTKDLKRGADAGLTKAMLDRLDLGRGRVAAIAASIEDVAKLPDPVGEILGLRTRPNGLRVGRMRAPIGVVGIIYESRPNVTADAGCLCVKSGNAVILRGGSEAFHSNQAIARLMQDAGREAGLPDHAIQFVPTTDRAAVQILLALDEDIDVIIPRGGRGLVEMIVERSKIPVIRHLDGNCFIYVDASADLEQAVHIVLNAKTQRTGVCNTLESLLVHQDAAPRLIPPLVRALQGKGVEIRADEAFRHMAGADAADIRPVSLDDWKTEYLDLILSAGVVGSLDEACDFINANGSHHTDAILTRDHAAAMRFLSAVDSACVFVNASTRFADGGEFGLGCEIGISTNKLHARGPMGLEELTTSKWIAFGEGQVRS
jgi:glutamate-5-semialdehyde dehydrogenase